MKYYEHENNFYAADNDAIVGEISFSRAGDTIYIIDHTVVNPTHRGQGIAEKLVELVVDKARSENKLIIPLCPYAAKQFKENPEYQDVLKK